MTPSQQSQSQPLPRPETNKSKKHGSLVLAIILFIICLGLGTYIILDKFVFNTEQEITVEESIANTTEALSKVKLSTGEQRNADLANALSGRVFFLDASQDQTIEFTSNSDYVYTYYKNPTTDYRKLKPSTSNGKFTVKDDTISLASGDKFKIVGDYLVKISDDISKNVDYVYFDSYQTKYIANNLSNAFSTFVTKQAKATENAIAIDKVNIDFNTISCKVGDRHLTNADSFTCSLDYFVYANQDSTNKAIEEDEELETFLDYCETVVDNADFTKNGTCQEDYYIKASANMIVRISDDGYRVTGIFR